MGDREVRVSNSTIQQLRTESQKIATLNAKQAATITDLQANLKKVQAKLELDPAFGEHLQYRSQSIADRRGRTYDRWIDRFARQSECQHQRQRQAVFGAGG